MQLNVMVFSVSVTSIYRKLFELLSLCTALAELSWPAILSKRHMFRYIKLSTNALEYQKMGYHFISG